MMRSIWRVTQNTEDAEEALQEALTVIWRRLGRIQKHANPHALVLRICLNAAYDVLRRRSRQQRREQAASVPRPRPALTPGDVLEARERESAIFGAIARLSRNQALAVMLRLVDGESYATIARALGCRDSTARKHVARGRARLCELLAPLAPHLSKEGAR